MVADALASYSQVLCKLQRALTLCSGTKKVIIIKLTWEESCEETHERRAQSMKTSQQIVSNKLDKHGLSKLTSDTEVSSV